MNSVTEGGTGCFRKASLMARKAFLWLTDHCHWAFLCMSASKGLARVEKLKTNFQ